MSLAETSCENGPQLAPRSLPCEWPDRRASHSAGLLGRNLVLPETALVAADQLAAGGHGCLDELPRRILASNTIFEAFGKRCHHQRGA